METTTYTLPAHWASALINDDRTGLEDDDERQLDALMAGEGLPAPLSCSDESFFCTYHDARPYGVLACDCLEYVFAVEVDDANADASVGSPSV